MTNVTVEYKNSVNSICANDIRITAEDILAKYKEHNNAATIEENVNPSTTETKKSNIRKFKKASSIWKIVVPAAIVFAFSTVTVFAATVYRSEIAQMISDIFGDSTTARIVDQGYYYAINDKKSDSFCKFELVGVSGDKANPIILCDVTVNSSKEAKQIEEMTISSYIIEKSKFENDKDRYDTRMATGVRDEKNSKVFHFRIAGPYAHIINEQNVVMEVVSVSYTKTDGQTVDYNPGYKFEFTVPMSQLKTRIEYYFNNMSITYKGVVFNFLFIEYNEYQTKVIFRYDQTYDPDSGMEELEYQQMLSDIADELFEDAYIELNGVRYDMNAIGINTVDSEPNSVGRWMEFDPMYIDENSVAYFCVNGEKLPAIKGQKAEE